MARVLREDGLLLILELGEPESTKVWNKLATLFIRYVVPWLGAIFTCSRNEYNYLQQSMHRFPNAATFQRVLIECGDWKAIHYERYLWGLGPHLWVLRRKTDSEGFQQDSHNL